jgi:hypothetical protein
MISAFYLRNRKGARLLFELGEEEHRNFETAQPVRQPDTGYVCSVLNSRQVVLTTDVDYCKYLF